MKMVSFSCFSLLRQRAFRLLAAWLLLFGIATVAEAQMINFKFDITYKYEEIQGNGKGIMKTETVNSGMKVATFGVESAAKRAINNYFNTGAPIRKGSGDCYDDKEVKGGKANNLKGDSRGYFVLTIYNTQLDTAIVAPVAKYYNESTNTVNFSTEILGEKVLKAVEKRGKQKARGDKQGSARIYGNKVVVKGQVRVDSMYARGDARFVAIPRLMEVDGNGRGKDRVVHYFSPMVFDGQPYEETQYRRMGYNLKNDQFDKYKINRDRNVLKTEVLHDGFKGQDSTYMETGETYIFNYEEAYEPIDRTKKYNARLHRRYLDYNKVYRDERDFLFWDGNLQDPMLFLDWSSARSMLDLDPHKYAKEAQSEISKANKSVKLEFETGKTTLNQEDSLTMSELAGLEKMLHRWYTDESAEVRDVYVKGFASPEGGYNTNKSLAAGRASTLLSILKNQAGARKVQGWHHDSDVVSWDEVADSLERRIGTPEALEAAEGIRFITSSTKDRDAQSRQIQSTLWYPYVKDNALKMVRRVTITVAYVATRILTPEEIFEKYEKDQPKGYRQGIGEKDYEYYHLMNRLYQDERWDELYTISKAAYDNVEITGEQATRARRKVDGEVTDSLRQLQKKAGLKADTVVYFIEEDRNNPYYRPYTLAAYYMSVCKLRKEQADTTLLTDFIDDHRMYKEKNPDLGQGFGIWNEPAIVMNHILMYCYAKNFSRAEHYALNWLPDDPADPNYQIYHNLTMFVSCLNGHENDPEVQEYIKSTSPMNHAVIAAAQDTEAGFKEAMGILNDTTQVDYTDSKVHYMKAICRFRLNPIKDYEHPAYPSMNIYEPDPEDPANPKDFAAPMLEALRLNPGYLKQMETDGYFNDAYRRMVKYFWHCLQKGEQMADIARKYDVLRTKITVTNR